MLIFADDVQLLHIIDHKNEINKLTYENYTLIKRNFVKKSIELDSQKTVISVYDIAKRLLTVNLTEMLHLL